MRVRCPQCRKTTEYDEKSAYRPFCSERCKKIDLGAWASEEYVVPGEPLPSFLEMENPSAEGWVASRGLQDGPRRN